MTGTRIVLVTVLAAAVGPTAWAQSGTITDGASLFRFGGSASSPGKIDFSNGAYDAAFQNWWFYRVEGETQETPFPYAPAGPDSESWGVDTATLTWNASIAAFDAELRLAINEVGAGMVTVVEEMTITNTESTPLSLAVFNYFDADVYGTGLDDWADLVGGDPTRIRMTDEYQSDFMEFLGVASDAYDVSAYNSLLLRLWSNGVIDNLGNGGLPFGMGDFTGAFQWDLVIDPGNSVTVIEGLSINTAAVPEPATLSLLALAGLAMMRRRRR